MIPSNEDRYLDEGASLRQSMRSPIARTAFDRFRHDESLDRRDVSQSGLTHAENASRVFSAKGVQGDPAAGCRLERTLM
jgi:hypothetical protein